ncbi:MAG: glycosyltransferase family A protein [Advenella sp.]|nr:glycosyltransferase family A protein [Advenella sp.]
MSQVRNPAVTVVIPSYNSEGLIGRTIQSVLDQTWQDLEIIVVDDCSKDTTCSVVSKFIEADARVSLIKLRVNNGGPAAPRNVGVEAAKGDWIAFLDSDDIWHPQKLEMQMAVAKLKDAEFLSTQMESFTDDSKLSFEAIRTVSHKKLTFQLQRIKGAMPTSSILVRRSLILNFPFNEDVRYKAVEDYHCWLRILSSGKNNYKVCYPLVKYRHIAGQISANKISMLKKVYMVHKELPGGNKLQAFLFSLTHAFGGVYYRFIRKGL